MKITGLKKQYGDKMVLDIASLVIFRGEVLAVIGHNGSGKSTMAKMIASFFKDSDVKLDGVDISKSGLRIGYVAQKPYAFNMSLEDNIRINIKDLDEEIDRLIEELDLDSLRKQNAKKLSGGEMQKMALIRAMVNTYDILMLDEPTASMDEKSTEDAVELIKRYAVEKNSAVILITHEYDASKKVADRMIRLDGGKLVD